MANITEKTELNETPADGDLIYLVDVSDTTDNASGSDKKVTRANLVGGLSPTSHTHTESDITDLGTYQTQLAEGAFVNGDKTKLDGIEASADVTDSANVTTALSSVGISAHSDVDTDKSKTPADGDVLTFDGTDWNAETPSAGGGGQTTYDIIIASSGGDYTTLGAYVTAGATAGDRILIMDDTTETGNVTIGTDNISIFGAGAGARIGASTYTITIDGDNVQMKNVGFSITTGKVSIGGSYCVFDGLDFSISSVTTGEHVELKGLYNTFTNSVIYSSTTSTSQNTTFLLTGSYCSVTNNTFRIPVKDSSLHAFYESGSSNKIIGNHFEPVSISASSVFIRLRPGSIFSNNDLVGNPSIAVLVDVVGDGAMVSNNNFTTGQIAVRVGAYRRGTITNNIITGCGQSNTNVIAHSGYQSSIVGNMIDMSSSTSGIAIAMLGGAFYGFTTITGNTVIRSSSGCTGVSIATSSADNVITGNYLKDMSTPISDSGTGTITSGYAV